MKANCGLNDIEVRLLTKSFEIMKGTETCLYLVIDWLDILGGDSRMNFDRA